MSVQANIHNGYRPIQANSIYDAVKGVSYLESAPDFRLHNFIHCYWQLKANEKLNHDYNHRVLADGCIDIFFQLENPDENFIMGFSNSFTDFSVGNSFNYIGICFLPAMFPLIFNVNAADFKHTVQPLKHIAPDIATFIKENIRTTMSHLEISRLLNNYFLKKISEQTTKADQRFLNAVHKIIHHSGNIDIEKDLNTGLSPRQLRRYFDFYIGDTPKSLSKVVRFQKFLNAKPSKQSLRHNKIYFDYGYYDQSHFIKEFKNFYGATPAKAFESQTEMELKLL